MYLQQGGISVEKVKLFTHTDLDGIGCAVLAKLVLKDADIEYAVPGNIDRKVRWFIEEEQFEHFDRVFITDLSVNEETAQIIQAHCRDKIILLDHHKTALDLNQYPWAKVVVESEVGLECGTHLFKEYLKDVGVYTDQFDDFVENVRRYDTWEWYYRFNDPRSKKIDDLFRIYGRERFMAYLLDTLPHNPVITFSEQDELLLTMKEEQFKRYLHRKNRDLLLYRIGDYTAGVVFAEQHISELGNELAVKHPECDFIALINVATGVSYRTVKDVDLAKIAQSYGGGGHAKASGSRITSSQRKQILDILFEQKEKVEAQDKKPSILQKIQWFTIFQPKQNRTKK